LNQGLDTVKLTFIEPTDTEYQLALNNDNITELRLTQSTYSEPKSIVLESPKDTSIPLNGLCWPKKE